MNLIPSILDMVDAMEIPLKVGFELSHLSIEDQNLLFDYIKAYGQKIDLKAAFAITHSATCEKLTNELISRAIEKKKNNVAKKISFTHNDLKRFFPESLTTEEITKKILELLEKHFT